jgi:hypothetical protein
MAAILAIEWFRIPQREGAAGFFGMGVSLLALLLSIALGVACARHIAAGQSPSVLKAWGLASAIIVSLGLLSVALMWLFADLPPKWQGRRLELVVELRCPPGFTLPSLEESSTPYATIIRLPSGEPSGWSPLQLQEARTEADSIVLPAVLELATSAPSKAVSIRLGEAHHLIFPLEFGATPEQSTLQWSRWLEATTPLNTASSTSARPQSPEHTFYMRYRVQQEPPPKPTRTREGIEAEVQAKVDAEFNALAADAPLSEWLRFTRYDNPRQRQRQAAAAIRARPSFQQDMIDAISGANLETSTEALRSLPHFAAPPIELAGTVARFGEDIAAELRALHELAADDPARNLAAANISIKFSAWMEAVRSLHGHGGSSFIPQLQGIANLSRRQPIEHVIAIDVLRVASYYLHTWAGIAPLPEDPPPR